MRPSKNRRPWFALLVHAVRIGLVVSLLLAIPSPTSRLRVESGTAPNSELIADIVGDQATLDSVADSSGLWTVKYPMGNDRAASPVAKIARTLPIAEDVVGYRGPTEALILLDQELNIVQVRLLASADTSEHVEAVIADDVFFEQFRGWPWGGPGDSTGANAAGAGGQPREFQVDAVSGATLTSLALAAGVLKRIGGERPSLVFSDEVTADEKAKWLADSFSSHRLLRTGPLTDDIAGYQGPTELLLRIGDNDQVDRIRLRQSFDNEPYVDYVRTEAGFWAIFEGKTIDELAAFDPIVERVEGVSGATMTSLAVADTIVAAAKATQRLQRTPTQAIDQASYLDLRWTLPDVVTISVLILVAIASWFGWFRKKWLRRSWLVMIVLIVGFWSGNLVSMALIAGWGAEGIAWRLAPGLAAMAIVAMAAPVVTKGNPYCNHLCPHGAIQQIIRPSSQSRRRLRLSPKWQRALQWVPGVTLVIAYVMLVIRPAADLSSWEPFHAYLFRVAGWGSILLAIVSLSLSAVIPMGYCRMGCPTGRLLDYLRRTASSDKIRLADCVVLALLLLAWIANRS